MSELLRREMMRSIQDADSERAEALQRVLESPELLEGIAFVPASKDLKTKGAETCLVFSDIPNNITTHEAILNFIQHLNKEIQQRGAFYSEPNESHKKYVVTQLFGEPEEVYALSAFNKSLERRFQLKIRQQNKG